MPVAVRKPPPVRSEAKKKATGSTPAGLSRATSATSSPCHPKSLAIMCWSRKAAPVRNIPPASPAAAPEITSAPPPTVEGRTPARRAVWRLRPSILSFKPHTLRASRKATAAMMATATGTPMWTVLPNSSTSGRWVLSGMRSLCEARRVLASVVSSRR